MPPAAARSRLSRATGIPDWAVAGALTGLLVLGVTMVGLYWDIAWHVDHGRDEELFTAPHNLILFGQAGLVAAAVVAAVLATNHGEPVGVRVGPARVPWSALLIVVFRLGGMAAFFVDDLWHRAYGLDVTLWSPPHLVLLASGALGALSVWLMLVEALPRSVPTRFGRLLHAVACGSMLVGASTVQAEFDFGVAQFRTLALPVLIAAGGVFVLTLSRLALGPGGAVLAALVFLALRGGVAVVVAALGHTVPRFPLYLPAALCVEAAGRGRGGSTGLRFPIVCGALAGTVGLAVEWAWAETAGGHHLTPAAWPAALGLGLLASVGAAVLAAALGRTVLGLEEAPGLGPVAAALAVAVALAVPVPRGVGRVEADISLDRVHGAATVTVQPHPPGAIRQAARFDVVAVQGGGRVRADLQRADGGRFLSSRAVPVGDSWKTFVRLERGNEVMAAAVHLPADASAGAAAVPAAPNRRVTFANITTVLQREARAGPRWPAAVAYGALAGVVALWLALLVHAAGRLRPP